MSHDILLDERFDEIVAALRAETPETPRDLRDRVSGITAGSPAPRRFTVRRVLALAAPAVVGLSLATALAVGVSSALEERGNDEQAAVRPTPAQDSSASPPAVLHSGVTTADGLTVNERAAQGEAFLAPRRSALPGPAGTRAQDYRATLTLLVDGTDDLSASTQRALRATRRLGGYVVSVAYRTPEPGEGTAAVRVRIPISRVQAAIVQFNGLGRILAQDTSISDLQQPLDELTRRIRRLERRAAAARGAERARIEAQILGLRRQRSEIDRRAAFATVQLDLTTNAPAKPEAAPGRLRRAVDDAIGVLAAELAIGAFALIVATPLLLLLLAGFLGSRVYRRHADQRLLERI